MSIARLNYTAHTKVSMRKPNQEQKVAIDSHGGVLSAGAGSGKTFVLIEHTLQKLIELAEVSFNQHSHNWQDHFVIESSKIALMTFTKKAAAEMKQRLESRIKNAELPHFLSNEILTEASYGVFVGTIHSFLLKLIRDGVVDGVESVEITSSRNFEKDVDEFVDESLLKIQKKISSRTFSSLLSNLDQIKISFKQIFNDAELRVFWESFDPSGVTDNFWRQFYQLCEIAELLEIDIPLKDFPSDSSKTWYIALEKFKLVQDRFPKSNFHDHLIDLSHFFDDVKRITPPRKSEYEKIIHIISLIRDLRTSFKAARYHLECASSNPEEMNEFYKVLKNIFELIDQRIKFKNKLTFSSLEYIISKASFDMAPLKYLMVDEFQDTSWAQHEIIGSLVQGGWSNIFCVGDKKQAIYRFRGGEIDVFDKTIELSQKNYHLISNYRSQKNIVNFNNGFFSKIFPLGIGFKRENDKAVKMEIQDSLNESRDIQGEVSLLQCSVDQSDKKYLNQDIEILEAQLIYLQIKTLKEKDQNDVAILYSRLAPSYHLIKILLKNNYSLVTQAKMPIFEQPVIGIIITVIENALDFYPHEGIAQAKIQEIVQLLGLSTRYLVSKQRVINNAKYFGCAFALVNEINLLGLTITDRSNTINLIEEISESASGSLENVWVQFKGMAKEKLSLEFRNIQKQEMIVQIMTVHSSKGLEFDNVILGGIHTNGAKGRDEGLLRKWPGSFKWMPNLNAKKLAQSPNYILESLESKRLDYNEQKRLLYVACTRAISSLYFPFIVDQLSNEIICSNKNSWVRALDLFRDHISQKEVAINIERYTNNRKLPFFHIDHLGIINRNVDYLKYHLTVDHSVTALSDLFSCPRKYYLASICKYDDELMDFLHDVYSNDLPDQYKKFIPKNIDKNSRSNKDRGNEFHRHIENYIKRGLDQSSVEQNNISVLKFCFDELDKVSKENKLLSEYGIKFKFNGQFINGICDLVILGDGNDIAEVWDFKTGLIEELNKEKYHAQLSLYAVGILELFPELKSIKLKLIYLDEQKIVEDIFRREDIPGFADKVAQKIKTPWMKNESNCQICEYQKICQVKLINC